MYMRESIQEPGAVDIILNNDVDRRQLEHLFYNENVEGLARLLDRLRKGKPITFIWDPYADKSNDMLHYFFMSGYGTHDFWNGKMVRIVDEDKYGSSMRVLIERMSAGAKKHYSDYSTYQKALAFPEKRAKAVAENTARMKEELDHITWSGEVISAEQIRAREACPVAFGTK